MQEPKEIDLINSPYAKLLVKVAIGAFAFAGAMYKFDQKMDDISNRIVKKFDEHIIADSFEKKELNSKIEYLEQQIANIQDDAKAYFKSEFIKPNEPTIERKRR